MLIRLHNKSNQTLVASVHEDDGTMREIRLDPSAISEAVDNDKLTQHTKQLVSGGLLKVRNPV